MPHGTVPGRDQSDADATGESGDTARAGAEGDAACGAACEGVGGKELAPSDSELAAAAAAAAEAAAARACAFISACICAYPAASELPQIWTSSRVRHNRRKHLPHRTRTRRVSSSGNVKNSVACSTQHAHRKSWGYRGTVEVTHHAVHVKG